MNKKSTLIKLFGTMLVSGFSFLSFGQIILQEGFENATFPPAGWTVVDADGTPDDDWKRDALLAVAPQEGGACATSYSWFNNVTYTPDNWLISPQFTVADATVKLSFYGMGTYGTPQGGMGEFMEVYISTTGNQPSDFIASLGGATYTLEQWERQEISLAAYAGQSVYIAFRHYNTTDQWVLGLDNIIVAGDYTDLSIYGNDDLNPYTAAPTFQGNRTMTMTANVTNGGTLPVAAFAVQTSIFKAPDFTTAIQTYNTPVTTAINPGDSVNVSVGTYTLTADGTYEVRHNLLVAGDAITANDTIRDGMSMTTNLFARDRGNYYFYNGFPNAAGSQGNVFNVSVNATLDSVMFALATATAGVITYAEITKIDGTANDTVTIGRSDSLTIDQTLVDFIGTNGLAVITLPVKDLSGNQISLTPGNYYVGLRKPDATQASMRLVYSSGVSTLGGSLLRNIGENFSAIDTMGFDGGIPLVRAYVNAPGASISENDDDANLLIFPNPSAGNFTVAANNLKEYEVIELQDQLGRVIGSWNINGSMMHVSTKNVADGNYLMVVRGQKGRIVKHVQVQQ